MKNKIDNRVENRKKDNKYGLISLACLIISIFSFQIWLMITGKNEIISEMFFYCGVLLDIFSFILGLVGIVKDKKKIMSMISIVVNLLFIAVVIYYINAVLPKEVEEAINSWQNSWGITSH